MPARNLDHLLTAAPTAEACASVQDWWPRQVALCAAGGDSMDHAIGGGFAADRFAWAFCSGYQAALRALSPALPAAALASLCVTESGGNQPRFIQTTLAPDPHHPRKLLLNGHKRWTTLGGASSLMLVAARVASAGSERAVLKIVQVAHGTPGVSFRTMSNISFVPEVAHAEVRFEGVSVAASDVLEGDGYARYVKPFRTLEDLHVHAAILAYLLREARRLAWPHAWIERCLALLYALRTIAERDASAAATHVALAGALSMGAELVTAADAHWQGTAEAAKERWERDKGLLAVAAAAREKRSQRAWERLTMPSV